ncbi:syndecan-1 [Talpa occidentalis]|uniref:syndecan-1 n=1 Tax=Talpa occidentalis TaxID=50954 RepID=UPI0023F8F65B|nr:syndecan-1 [Talpa occidentalis]
MGEAGLPGRRCSDPSQETELVCLKRFLLCVCVSRCLLFRPCERSGLFGNSYFLVFALFLFSFLKGIKSLLGLIMGASRDSSPRPGGAGGGGGGANCQGDVTPGRPPRGGWSRRSLPVALQIVATNVPPEDQDSSGDDSDNFSGSGAGALPDITLTRQPHPTWKDLGLLPATPTAPEPTDRDTIVTSFALPPGGGSEGEEAEHVVQVEPGFTPWEKESTHPSHETTQHPTAHRTSTARAATAPGPATSHPDHHETTPSDRAGQHGPHVHSLDEESPSATERATEDGASNQLPVGEGSGEPDFTFDTAVENSAGAGVELDRRNQLPVDHMVTGTSQSLLDRKEVLGGVIAGGLVGLIFAVCLVGFMLYRMKKKDEGSYSLEEPKQANGGAYQKPSKQEEFYA